jgi:hypothetical protein
LVPHSLGSKFHSKGNCLALQFYTAPDFDKKKRYTADFLYVLTHDSLTHIDLLKRKLSIFGLKCTCQSLPVFDARFFIIW